jgi:hypothetical protein
MFFETEQMNFENGASLQMNCLATPAISQLHYDNADTLVAVTVDHHTSFIEYLCAAMKPHS